MSEMAQFPQLDTSGKCNDVVLGLICEQCLGWTDGAQSEVLHENKAVWEKTSINYQKLNGESTRNILLNEEV